MLAGQIADDANSGSCRRSCLMQSQVEMEVGRDIYLGMSLT